MKLKKVLALSLAMIMTVSAFTACGNTAEEEETPVSSSASESSGQESQSVESEPAAEENEGITFPLEEEITFTGITVLNADQYKVSESLAWSSHAEDTNVKFEFTDILNSEAQEKVGLLFAGDNYPEFFYKINYDYNTMGTEGMIIPLEDLIREYMPNLSAILDERDGWYSLEAPDGHIYSLPNITPAKLDNGGSPLWINKKWIDELGLEMPTNLDELYNVLKAFKENDPNGNGENDEIPFTLTVDNSWYPARRFIQYVGDGLQSYTTYLMYKDGEINLYPFTDSFKDNYIGFLKKLYDEEILDQNAFTQTHEQLHALGQSKNVYGMFFATNSTVAIPKENAEDYVLLKPFAPLPFTGGIGANGMAITDKCENPEVLCAWMDYFYGDEGSRLATMGVEGVTYTLNEAGEYSVAEGHLLGQDGLNGTSNWAGAYHNDAFKVDSEKDPAAAWINDQYYNEEYGLYVNEEYYEMLPGLKYTEEETQTKADIEADVKPYVATYIAQTVTGQLDLEDSWEDFQKTLRDMRAEELLEIHKAAYERFLTRE